MPRVERTYDSVLDLTPEAFDEVFGRYIRERFARAQVPDRRPLTPSDPLAIDRIDEVVPAPEGRGVAVVVVRTERSELWSAFAKATADAILREMAKPAEARRVETRYTGDWRRAKDGGEGGIRPGSRRRPAMPRPG